MYRNPGTIARFLVKYGARASPKRRGLGSDISKRSRVISVVRDGWTARCRAREMFRVYVHLIALKHVKVFLYLLRDHDANAQSLTRGAG